MNGVNNATGKRRLDHSIKYHTLNKLPGQVRKQFRYRFMIYIETRIISDKHFCSGLHNSVG